MAHMMMAPPDVPPRVAVGRGDGSDRLRVRSYQVSVSVVTILVTGWCFTLGWVPGVVAAMFAKHILVAVLMWGLGVDEQRAETP